MLQVIYMMYIGLSLTKDPIIEKKLRKEAAQEYQKIFKGTKVSYMERLFNRAEKWDQIGVQKKNLFIIAPNV